jgi:predicted nucleic acid-binding protein
MARVLVDTNILLRSLNPDDPHYAAAERALSALRLRDETLCLAPQNLIEFWAVVTRPREDNGLGMTPARAANELISLRQLFRVLPASPDVLEAWRRIVAGQGITGKQTHDAHLVAVMQVYAVAGILTFNAAHFRRFPGITVLDPAQTEWPGLHRPGARSA